MSTLCYIIKFCRSRSQDENSSIYLPNTLFANKRSLLWRTIVQYASGRTPTDLWKTYFTSSKKVQRRTSQFDINSFKCQIRKIHSYKCWKLYSIKEQILK